MDHRIVYTKPDGGVSIVIPAEGWRRPDEPIGDFLARVIDKDVPPDGIARVVLVPEIPSDRTFREAWSISSDKVVVDMTRARNVIRNILRDQRAPLLQALDVEYQRADESGDNDKKKDVAARKQILRDLPQDPRIEAATTPAELKALLKI